MVAPIQINFGNGGGQGNMMGPQGNMMGPQGNMMNPGPQNQGTPGVVRRNVNRDFSKFNVGKYQAQYEAFIAQMPIKGEPACVKLVNEVNEVTNKVQEELAKVMKLPQSLNFYESFVMEHDMKTKDVQQQIRDDASTLALGIRELVNPKLQVIQQGVTSWIQTNTSCFHKPKVPVLKSTV